MLDSIIVYGSEYGSAQEYAQELAKQLKLKCIDYRHFDVKKSYQTIIYIGSLYAGGVKGMASSLGKISSHQYQDLLLASVGLSDPKNQKNTDKIKEHLKKQVPNLTIEDEQIFHLRGAIDYSKLTFIHRILMGMLYRKVRKTPESQLDAESRQLLETYNKTVNFIDLTTLDPIIQRYLQIYR